MFFFQKILQFLSYSTSIFFNQPLTSEVQLHHKQSTTFSKIFRSSNLVFISENFTPQRWKPAMPAFKTGNALPSICKESCTN